MYLRLGLIDANVRIMTAPNVLRMLVQKSWEDLVNRLRDRKGPRVLTWLHQDGGGVVDVASAAFNAQ